MTKNEMMALAERIACRHKKMSTTEVTEVCLKIASAYDSMVAANESPWVDVHVTWHQPETINCRCYIKPVPVGIVIPPYMQSMPQTPHSDWRVRINDLSDKSWPDDAVVEISAGMQDIRWRGTIQEVRNGKFPHTHQGVNQWRFLACESSEMQCLNVTHRPAALNDVSDDTTFVATYADGPPVGEDANWQFKAQRLADIDWPTVLCIKRVLE